MKQLRGCRRKPFLVLSGRRAGRPAVAEGGILPPNPWEYFEKSKAGRWDQSGGRSTTPFFRMKQP